MKIHILLIAFSVFFAHSTGAQGADDAGEAAVVPSAGISPDLQHFALRVEVGEDGARVILENEHAGTSDVAGEFSEPKFRIGLNDLVPAELELVPKITYEINVKKQSYRLIDSNGHKRGCTVLSTNAPPCKGDACNTTTTPTCEKCDKEHLKKPVCCSQDVIDTYGDDCGDGNVLACSCRKSFSEGQFTIVVSCCDSASRELLSKLPLVYFTKGEDD